MFKRFREMRKDDQLAVVLVLGATAYALSLFLSIILGLWFYTMPIVALGFAFIAFAAWNYYAAEWNKGWLTTIKETTGKEIVAGKNFVDYIPNHDKKFYHTGSDELRVATNGEDKETWLMKHFGRTLIGWNPAYKVRYFPVEKIRIKDELTMPANAEIEDMIEVGETSNEDHLDHVIVRPTVHYDVDLNDNTRIWVLTDGMYEVFRPKFMLEDLDAKFFRPLQTVVKAAIVAKYGKLTSSNLSTSLVMEITVQDLLDQDIVNLVGLKPKSIKLVKWSRTPEDRELQKAAQAERMEKDLGAGRIAKETADAEAATIRAAATRVTGEAEAFVQGKKDEAAYAGEILSAQRLAEFLGQSGAAYVLGRGQTPNLTTVVEAGFAGNLSMMLPTDPKSPTPKAP